MINTIIIGKRSYLSKNLRQQISNSHVFSLKDIGKLLKLPIKNKKINIIYNHAYPISKLSLTEDYAEIIKKNILSFNNFINFIIKKKIKVKNFILSSSSSVYGIDPNKMDINLFDNNKSIYSASKFLMERLLISQKKNLNCKIIIARIFNIYGPNDKTSLISKIIDFKKNNSNFKISCNNNTFRDFIHIDDLIKIYKFFLKKKLSGIYDIGTGSVINVKKLIKRYFKKKNYSLMNKNNLINEIKFSKAKNNYLKLIRCKIPSVNLKKYLDNSLIEVK